MKIQRQEGAESDLLCTDDDDKMKIIILKLFLTCVSGFLEVLYPVMFPEEGKENFIPAGAAGRLPA